MIFDKELLSHSKQICCIYTRSTNKYITKIKNNISKKFIVKRMYLLLSLVKNKKHVRSGI